MIEIMSHGTPLPVYYPEDAEVYLRAGYLGSGEMMVALFNLGHDELEDIPLSLSGEVKRVEALLPSGERETREFVRTDNGIRISERVPAVTPVILFLS